MQLTPDLQFLGAPPDSSLLYFGIYDPWLVLLSILIAVFAAYAALDVASRIASSTTRTQAAWWTGIGAMAMGGGTWAMHYTAMAAAYFISDGRPDIADSGFSASFLALWVGIVTMLLIGLVLVATMAWRQRDLARRLLTSEQRIRRILDTTQEGFVMINLAGELVQVNPAFARLLGGRTDDLLGRALHDFVDAANHTILVEQGAKRARGEQSVFEIELSRLDGTPVPCQFSTTPIQNDVGVRIGSCALVSDLSGRRAHEAYVRQVVAMFESTAEGVMLTDLSGAIVSVNPAFTEVTGYSEAESLGRNAGFLRSGRHGEEFYQAMWTELAASGHWRGEIWNRRKNGEVYPEWLTISAVRDAAGAVQSYVGVFSDISHIKRSEAELERLAHFDPLTGLPNRILLHDQLSHAIDRAIRRKERLAVMVLDLDGFKTVNDSLGHPAGDLLLRTIAERLQGMLRREDTVARLGGDEFAVIAEAVGNSKNPGLIAEKLIQAVAEPVDLDGHIALVTASVGIAIFPDDGRDTTTLLQAADMAMYASKQAGRNTSRFHHTDMTRAAQRRLRIEHGLRRALDQDELEVWFQPQFSLTSGMLIGSEALMRWRSPERGLVSPNEFIAIAEETGLILLLGEWVLRQSCRHAVEWRERGLEAGSISVNVAGPQIERGGFFNIVESVLRETGWQAERLELEITESFLLRNAEQAMDVVNKLSGLGVKVAIDDFGTGYSSLSYLKYLRVNKLKLDQSFVRDLPDNRDDAAITRAIIALGHSLDFSVIAEGVENESQREFLKQEGCDQAQGYLYSQPLPAAEFESFLRSRNVAA